MQQPKSTQNEIVNLQKWTKMNTLTSQQNLQSSLFFKGEKKSFQIMCRFQMQHETEGIARISLIHL